MPSCPMATIVEGLLMLRWRVMVVGEIPRALPMPARFREADPPAAGPQLRGRKPLILRCWVDDSTAGDLGTEESITAVVRGLRAIELLAASDHLVVNRTKSAIAATPGDFKGALTILIQGRASWDRGGVLVLREDEVEQALLDIIAERLGVEGLKVHTAGLDQVPWSKAGRATVLVHLPGAGIPPLTVSAIEAGGGVVLRGWPDTWANLGKDKAAQALREHLA